MTNGNHASGLDRMLDLVGAFPDHLAASFRLPGLAECGTPAVAPRRILLCGMGGSAVAGDLIQPLLSEQPLGLDVWRDYGLPHWTGPNDLVVVGSYSGNTEETLSALVEARRRGCGLVGITSGGSLLEAARGAGGPVFPAVELPGGLPPRAALGHSLGALIHLLAARGILPEAQARVTAVADLLRELAGGRAAPHSVPGASGSLPETAGNPVVADLAATLVNRIPVIYTAGAEAHAAGQRWKAQLNENAKVPALLAAFPELDHNDVVGWSLPDDLRERVVLIMLRAEGEDARTARRVDVTGRLLAGEFAAIREIRPAGADPLARVLSLVQYGDFLSCHLAGLRGVDPVPVARIQELKAALAAADE